MRDREHNLFEWGKCARSLRRKDIGIQMGLFQVRSKWKCSSHFGEIAFNALNRVCAIACDFYAHFEKKSFIYPRNEISVLYTRCSAVLPLKKKKVMSKGIYTWKRAVRPNGIPGPPIIPASHPTVPSSLSPLLSPPSPPSCHSNVQRFNGPPRSKTPGKIIQISSLRFPSNPGERRRIDPCRRTTHGLPRGLACQLTSPKASQIIKRRLLTEQQGEKAAGECFKRWSRLKREEKKILEQ